jgi:hypothetical protein
MSIHCLSSGVLNRRGKVKVARRPVRWLVFDRRDLAVDFLFGWLMRLAQKRRHGRLRPARGRTVESQVSTRRIRDAA